MKCDGDDAHRRQTEKSTQPTDGRRGRRREREKAKEKVQIELIRHFSPPRRPIDHITYWKTYEEAACVHARSRAPAFLCE